MNQRHFLLTLALFATVGATAYAALPYYQDIWPTTADGNMDAYPDEGYAIVGEGYFRGPKSYHHIPYFGFTGRSDGADGIPDGHSRAGQNDHDDGAYLADWLVGKKVFNAVLYYNSNNAACDPAATSPNWLYNFPQRITGFRCGNVGTFNDRGIDENGVVRTSAYGGCCASYVSALLDGGENAPPAWRMGRPDLVGNKKYSQIGDIGPGDAYVTPEYYLVSSKDTAHAGQTVSVGTLNAFGTEGYGGFSTNSGLVGTGRFAFDWLLETSDAHLRNSVSVLPSDCSLDEFGGGAEPRDYGNDGIFGFGWFATHLDRCLVNGLAFDPEIKGLTLDAVGVSMYLNGLIASRDQSGGLLGPYIWVWATVAGDVNNNYTVDAPDLLAMASSWPLSQGQVGFNDNADLNCDGKVNIVDLLVTAQHWMESVPPQPDRPW